MSHKKMADEKRICKNCSAELFGEFCSSCGQRDKDIHVPVKELASEFIDVLPAFDRRLIRSLKPLLFAPGFLTMEYLSGKRKQYISPFKLYFVISFVFFLLSSLMDEANERKQAVIDGVQETQAKREKGDSTFVSVSAPSGLTFTVKDSTKAGDVFGPKMISALRKVKENPSLMFDKIREHRPKIIFLLMPVFALLLKLLYIRSKTLYIKHLVFSFYFHSVIFSMLLLIDLFEMTGLPMLDYLAIPLYFGIPVNLYYGLKRVYGQSGWKTFVKLFLLSISYGVAFLITVVAAAFIIIYLFFT
ncbi:MAG: DUF3667 domain-containing protein [Bacteroidota bacterium]